MRYCTKHLANRPAIDCKSQLCGPTSCRIAVAASCRESLTHCGQIRSDWNQRRAGLWQLGPRLRFLLLGHSCPRHWPNKVALSSDCHVQITIASTVFYGHATDMNVHPTFDRPTSPEADFGVGRTQRSAVPAGLWLLPELRFAGCGLQTQPKILRPDDALVFRTLIIGTRKEAIHRRRCISAAAILSVAFRPLVISALLLLLFSLTLGVGVLILCDRRLRMKFRSFTSDRTQHLVGPA